MSNESIVEEKKVEKEIDLELAQQVVSEVKQKRINSCAQEINDVLKKWNCSLDVSVIVTSTGNIPQVRIIALD